MAALFMTKERRINGIDYSIDRPRVSGIAYLGGHMVEGGPGRPAIGPMVNVRLSQELIDALDVMAEEHELPRAALIRLLLEIAVEDGGTFAPALVKRILGEDA